MDRRARSLIMPAWVLGLIILLMAGISMLILGAEAWLREDVVGPFGARVYYDAYHGARHPPDRQNLRHHHAYHTVSGTHRWVTELRRAGLEVHVESERGFDDETLAGFDVVILGEQSHEAKFLSARERADLLAWVEEGGGLLAFAAPPGSGASATAFDRLFEDLEVRSLPDSGADTSPPTTPAASPGPRRAVVTDPAVVHPVMTGVSEYLVRNAAGLETAHGIAFAGEGPASVAALEHGRGRIVVMSDIDPFTNPMLYVGDHLPLGHNAVSWIAPSRRDPRTYWVLPGVLALLTGALALFRSPFDRRARTRIAGAGVVLGLAWIGIRGVDPASNAGFDVFVHAGNGSTMDLTSEAPGGHFTLYGHWGKDPEIRPRLSGARIEAGHDALVLAAPTLSFSEDQLSMIDGYLHRGATVVYLASVPSLRSEAGRQLGEHFEFAVEVGEPLARHREPYRAHGPRDLLDGVFRVYVSGEAPPVRVIWGLEPVVHLTRGGSTVDDNMWTRRSCVYDLVSETRAGGLGRFVLVAPIEIFDNRGLGSLYKVGDEGVQQMTDLLIRVLQTAAGKDAFVAPTTG